jgi:hypothetical protein
MILKKRIMNKPFRIASIVAISALGFSSAFAQKISGSSSNLAGQDEVNAITIAVPFLTIAPDSRSAGIGDAGAASSPDANSNHWNASKLPFSDKNMGFAVSYTPWLHQLVKDINLAYLSGFYKIDKNQAISASLLYFSLGSIEFTNESGGSIGTYTPNELAVDAAYSRKLSDNFSGGFALRYIRSDLNQGISSTAGSEAPHAGQAVAADISAYYQNDVTIANYKTKLAFGLNISNTGNKDFLPTNLRLGVSDKLELDKYNSIALIIDFNKLLVPTPNPHDSTDAQKRSDMSVPSAIFGSFSDAPGGFKEEIKEITYSGGLEYWYDNQFALRAGYFHESATKGNRQYATVGLGLRFNVFGLDAAYLIPANSQNSPLQNTFRFTLSFIFDKTKGQNKPTAE